MSFILVSIFRVHYLLYLLGDFEQFGVQRIMIIAMVMLMVKTCTPCSCRAIANFKVFTFKVLGALFLSRT
ncbi:hypothetical protein CRG98_015566 [Punica granatum]|uniref:Uncharacterized protein n=1 Tax=Punica granatum TaxID=22663 RepID=A0A2I0K663_PUNGR|nr:hypothetical protein CRG98_015566 [Punica granatum]